MDEKKPIFGTYRAVKAEILRRIRVRDWSPGILLPPETELAEDFGCARATVNRAMRELADEGIVDRRRRAGTRVSEALTRRARFDIPLPKTEIKALGGQYRYMLIDRREEYPSPVLCSKLELAGDCRVIHIRALHFCDDKPFQYEDRWINLDVVPYAAKQSFENIGPSEWLLTEVPFLEAKVTFSASAADNTIASYLDLECGAPIFITERMTWSEKGVITFVQMSYPPGYKLTTHL